MVTSTLTNVRDLEVVKRLFSTPGVVNLSDHDDFEVQPEVFSSVYINLKSLASNASARVTVTKALAAHVELFDVDYVCGMELGGCYFASSVADHLAKELFFYRKSDKKYNIKNCFAGNIPHVGSRVVIIDDVLSSGNTIARATRELTAMGCEVYVVCVFSYGWDEQIGQNLGVTVDSLSMADDLVSYGTAHGLMKERNAQLINEYVAREEDRLVQPKEK